MMRYICTVLFLLPPLTTALNIQFRFSKCVEFARRCLESCMKLRPTFVSKIEEAIVEAEARVRRGENSPHLLRNYQSILCMKKEV